VLRLIALLVLSVPSIARAQIANAPPPDRTYEAWSMLTMRLVGAISSAPPGRNVRTEAGTFAAGGVLFESELPRPCP
jgi:hypothetical protein